MDAINTVVYWLRVFTTSRWTLERRRAHTKSRRRTVRAGRTGAANDPKIQPAYRHELTQSGGRARGQFPFTLAPGSVACFSRVKSDQPNASTRDPDCVPVNDGHAARAERRRPNCFGRFRALVTC